MKMGDWMLKMKSYVAGLAGYDMIIGVPSKAGEHSYDSDAEYYRFLLLEEFDDMLVDKLLN